jgi:hypothetical protein
VNVLDLFSGARRLEQRPRTDRLPHRHGMRIDPCGFSLDPVARAFTAGSRMREENAHKIRRSDEIRIEWDDGRCVTRGFQAPGPT